MKPSLLILPALLAAPSLDSIIEQQMRRPVLAPLVYEASSIYELPTGFFGATDLFEDDLLDLIFTNVAAPNVGDAAGLPPSVAANNFHISLHTGDALTDASTLQTDSEAAYTGYSRVAVARSTAGWTVASGNVDNDAAITFPISTSGPETETDVGIGFATSGAGVLQIFAQLASDLIVNNGITPEFAAGALDISLD